MAPLHRSHSTMCPALHPGGSGAGQRSDEAEDNLLPLSSYSNSFSNPKGALNITELLHSFMSGQNDKNLVWKEQAVFLDDKESLDTSAFS